MTGDSLIPSDNSKPATTARGGEWQRRPVLSAALRVAIFGVPVLASFGMADGLTRVLPHATSVWGGVLWLALIAIISLLTLVLVERGARRLLPLAALLNVSLLFPDKAPARFAVARRTGSPRDLRANLERAQHAGHDDDARSMESIIELVLALSVHDRASRGHSERVRVFTDLIADELKIPDEQRARLRWAALLHDIGKLEVPATILNKPGKPTEEEWATLHRHPEEGARLVSSLLPWLGEWGLAVVQHHERYDGTGYPHRLQGEAISLAARIVAVADTYEVMTAPRAYKRPMSVPAARQELVRVAGSQLDPAIVRAFLNISVGRLWRTIGVGAWVAQIPTLGRIFSLGGTAGSTFASAATATVLAVGGIAAAGGPVHAAAPSPSAAATALVPAQTAPNGHEPGRGSTSHPSPPGSTAASPPPVGGSPAPSAAAATPAPSTAPAPTDTAAPTPAPTAPATPVPTQPPTPAPTPDPWVCAGCTNTAAGCVSNCSNNNNTSCITWCVGDNNTVCQAHCFGNNNKSCTSYCQGANNKACQTNCRTTSVLASSWTRGSLRVVLNRLFIASGEPPPARTA